MKTNKIKKKSKLFLKLIKMTSKPFHIFDIYLPPITKEQHAYPIIGTIEMLQHPLIYCICLRKNLYPVIAGMRKSLCTALGSKKLVLDAAGLSINCF